VLGPGDTVTYAIRVTNTGTCDARGLVVTDQLDAFWNIGAATIGQGGTISPADTVRWDSTTTPALATLAPSASVDLTLTVPVNAGFTTETRDTNSVTIVAEGHPPACGSGSPTFTAVSNEVCLNCAVVVGRQDALVEAAPGPLALVLSGDQIPTSVVESPTPNATTCGETKLNLAQDVVATDVGATLATGVPVTAAQAAGVLVFFEVSERCDAEEGAPADPPIIVRKAAGGNFVITLAP
jgi:uncharacterized repeat protein (TIGR01451 family)